MISIVVIECDFGHVHSLATNELYSSPEQALKRFKELVLERHNGITKEQMEKAVFEGTYTVGFSTVLKTRPELV